MDRHPINCNWPDCSTYDDRCMVGINMPCVIEGEKLRAERLAANRGCMFTPWESFGVVAVTLAVIAAVAWVALS